MQAIATFILEDIEPHDSNVFTPSFSFGGSTSRSVWLICTVGLRAYFGVLDESPKEASGSTYL